MKTLSSLLLFTFLVSGCATGYHSAELSARLAPAIHLPKDGTFAFLPEPDMRPQKSDFYVRAELYLKAAGYKFTTPENAEYLIQVLIENGIPASPQNLAPRVIACDLTGGKRPETLHYFSFETKGSGGPYTAFNFFVYRGMDRDRLSGVIHHDIRDIKSEAVWTASTIVKATEFRQFEARFVQTIFSRFAENYDGWMTFTEATNQSPEPTIRGDNGLPEH